MAAAKPRVSKGEERQVVDTDAPSDRIVGLEWSRHDGMRLVTWAGIVGLVAAVAMARFGLPPIDLHGPLHRFGIMDPLCGGTRAARLTAQGRLGAAWTYNPLGIVATAAAAAVGLRLVLGVGTRRWVNLKVRWTPHLRWAAFALILVAAIALEIRQQGRVDLLTKPY